MAEASPLERVRYPCVGEQPSCVSARGWGAGPRWSSPQGTMPPEALFWDTETQHHVQISPDSLWTIEISENFDHR